MNGPAPSPLQPPPPSFNIWLSWTLAMKTTTVEKKTNKHFFCHSFFNGIYTNVRVWFFLLLVVSFLSRFLRCFTFSRRSDAGIIKGSRFHFSFFFKQITQKKGKTSNDEMKKVWRINGFGKCQIAQATQSIQPAGGVCACESGTSSSSSSSCTFVFSSNESLIINRQFLIVFLPLPADCATLHCPLWFRSSGQTDAALKKFFPGRPPAVQSAE